jgi:hypothetical protein
MSAAASAGGDAPIDLRDLPKLAREWADTITALDAPWHIKCEVMAWGFTEVQNTTRNPANVLKDVVDRIRARSRKEIEEPPE